MTTDRCGISSPPLWAFKNFRAIIKIRADAVCCIHVSTMTCLSPTIKSSSQSISVIFIHQMPDFAAKRTKFCSSQERHPRCGFTGEGRVRIYGGRGGRPPSRHCPVPSSRQKGKKRRKRMRARQENGLRNRSHGWSIARRRRNQICLFFWARSMHINTCK